MPSFAADNFISCVNLSLQWNPQRRKSFVEPSQECTSFNSAPRANVVADLGSNISCSSSLEQEVSLELQLGVLCEDSDGSDIVYEDIFFECGNEWSSMTSRSEEFSCGVKFKSPNLPAPFPSAGIETDYRWNLFTGNMTCVQSTPLDVMPPFAQVSRGNQDLPFN